MCEKIAVLIPCYNEALTIAKVISDFKREIPEAQIYVYDNNSTDGTDEIALRNGAVVEYEYRQGKGNVIRSMFRNIEADVYVLVDGDDTYPADAVREMCDLVIKKHADMVIGDRLSSTYFTENKRLFHNSGNKLVRFLINNLFQSDIHDIMSGYRVFSRKFVKCFPVLSKGFEIETEMTAFALDYNFYVQEIPVSYRDRPQGSISKLSTYKDGFRVLKTVFSLFSEYRPLRAFCSLGFVLVAISMCFFASVFIEYYHTGLVPRFPTLIVATSTGIIGFLLIASGIILDVIVRQNKRVLEVMYNQV